MIYNAYAIFDSKSKAFSRPFFAINDDVARRQFTIVANDPATEIGRHPADFSLHNLGTFDDALGTFDNEGPASNLGLAAAFKGDVNHASE